MNITTTKPVRLFIEGVEDGCDIDQRFDTVEDAVTYLHDAASCEDPPLRVDRLRSGYIGSEFRMEFALHTTDRDYINANGGNTIWTNAIIRETS